MHQDASAAGRVSWVSRAWRRGAWGVRTVAVPLVWWAGSAHAADALVHTTDGRTVRGELVAETDEAVVLRADGGTVTVPRDEIVDVVVTLTVAETFAARRAAVADDDLPGRVNLAAEMVGAELFEMAAGEIDALATRWPDEPFAASLAELLDAAETLASQAEAAAETEPATGEAQPGVRRTRAGLLTLEQITRIKLGEADAAAGDRSLRVAVPPAVLNDVFERRAGRDGVPADRPEQAVIRGWDGWRVIDWLNALGEREAAAGVRIAGDPAALRAFRQEVNPRYVWRYFGRHFGDGAVAGLRLEQARPNSVPEAYTNFARLTLFEHEQGRVIDRAQPDASLLLQWGLPRELAESPAPAVEGWRPYFRDKQDPQYQRLLAWIDSLELLPGYLDAITPAPDGWGAAAAAGPHAGA